MTLFTFLLAYSKFNQVLLHQGPPWLCPIQESKLEKKIKISCFCSNSTNTTPRKMFLIVLIRISQYRTFVIWSLVCNFLSQFFFLPFTSSFLSDFFFHRFYFSNWFWQNSKYRYSKKLLVDTGLTEPFPRHWLSVFLFIFKLSFFDNFIVRRFLFIVFSVVLKEVQG